MLRWAVGMIAFTLSCSGLEIAAWCASRAGGGAQLVVYGGICVLVLGYTLAACALVVHTWSQAVRRGAGAEGG